MEKTVYSKFHGREAIVAIKDRYCIREEDALAELNYEVYAGKEDAPYARRKLAEIKRKVCGGMDCKCAIFIR